MGPRRPRVLVVGDAIVDIFLPPSAGLAPVDIQRELPSIRLGPGGNATNFALEMASLGVATTFVGSVGRDALASVLLDAFRRYGVDARVRRDPVRPTGATLALAWTSGGRALLTAPGANVSFPVSDLSRAPLRGVRHVHRGGLWWTRGFGSQATARFLARARRLGASTSLDVATDPDGWSRVRVDAVRAILRHVTTFCGNEEEVRAIGGRRDVLAAARALCRLGADEVVIHRGARGAMRVGGREITHAAAFSVSPVNPTGCGDIFNAAYVFASLRGSEASVALEFANASAAIHLSDVQRAYPSARDIRAFLAAARSRVAL